MRFQRSAAFSGEMKNTRAGAQRVQDELGTFVPECKEVLKNDGVYVKTWPSFRGQISNNMNITINNGNK